LARLLVILTGVVMVPSMDEVGVETLLDGFVGVGVAEPVFVAVVDDSIVFLLALGFVVDLRRFVSAFSRSFSSSSLSSLSSPASEWGSRCG